ncbi:MAG: hypothetical protein J7K40_01720 [candidate division Zixibacteria bacterium]|nr:hypothetical protein [candidate division Zixibacteria bacterium]
MCNNQVKILIQAILFIAVLTVVSFSQVLGTACEPYGSISFRNEPIDDGLPVVAYINVQEVARCLTDGGQYSLIIEKDDPETSQKEGWAEDDIIVIRVNGKETTPHFTAQAGRIRFDLTVSTLSIQLNTWGKIKALFK